jgi:hypothetical protein
MCWQGREHSSLCPRCRSRVETVYHIHTCSHPPAIHCHHTILQTFLSSLSKLWTPPQLITVFHGKLSQVLELTRPDHKEKHEHFPPSLVLAIQHQIIIGWDLFIKGYTSSYWMHACSDLMPNSVTHFSSNWDVKLVDAAISLYKGIRETRNEHIQVNSKEESAKLQRMKIQDQVLHLYRHPPRLASRYSSIRKIPLQDRLKKSTTHLKHRISRIQHKAKVSDLLRTKDRKKQCCILSYCWRRNDDAKLMQKYPP